jgi:signal transduction histidine kinase
MLSRTLARWTFALLLTALALAGVLAYQAARAARSHQAVAEQTLREYAAISAWEVATNVRQDLLANHFLLFSPVNRAVGGQVLGGGTPLPLPADTLAAMLGAQAERCACARGVRFYFRIDMADSSLEVAGGRPVPPAVRRWIVDTVTTFTRIAAGPLPQVFVKPSPLVVRTRDGHQQVMAGLVTNFGQASLYGGPAEGLPERTLLLYLLPRTADGRPLAVYGVAVDPVAHVAPLLDGVLAKQRLLPPALTRGVPTDSLVALAVRDGAGRPLYRSAAAFPGGYQATDTLEARYGGLRVSVALNPRIAERAIPGGLPRSRLPALVALFCLTAGLAAVALVQLRRQQELARVRADFTSSVSHELRTPLAQIRLLAELLHMGKPDSEAGRRRAARIIDQESRRLSYLVENILAFSRAERGGAGRPAAGRVDVAAEAAEVLEMFTPLAAAAGARLELRAAPGAVALADSAAVRQVLLNFLDNAARYGPRGQRVAVGVDRVVEGFAREERVRLWVEDEGPGVPADERARVFEPYYRMARDAAVAAGGSGIGLAVVRDLVARQGGRAWVEPGAGGAGARFAAEFPAAPAAAAPRAARGGAPGAPNGVPGGAPAAGAGAGTAPAFAGAGRQGAVA